MEQRRTQRFILRLPLSITRSGAERVAFDGLTKNISSTGVLFTAGGSTGLGGPIEYIITLNHTDGETVNLRCMGRVVRADPIRPAGAPGSEPPVYQVAATLERYEFVRAQ